MAQVSAVNSLCDSQNMLAHRCVCSLYVTIALGQYVRSVSIEAKFQWQATL